MGYQPPGSRNSFQGSRGFAALVSIFLNILFLPPGASLDLTEALSSRKYEAYGEYQSRVSRCIPWFPKRAAPAPMM